MAGEVVPFGKYKGKPVEAMAQDRQYVDWLTAQSWFKERYANYYTLIVNNFQEPADTPEHNGLQAKFLDAKFCLRFVQFLGNYGGSAKTLTTEFEYHGFDIDLRGTHDTGRMKKWKDGYHEGESRIIEYVHYSIEIKPTVADDYPAILRQIKTALTNTRSDCYAGRPIRLAVEFGDPVLFLQEYMGRGATCEEFINIFERSNIRVVFLDEIEGD
jgi:hypothetical protein